MVKKVDASIIVPGTPDGVIMYGDYEVDSASDIVSKLADKVEGRTHTTEQLKSGYMVSVDGNSSPRRTHATIDEAKAEAERISKSQQGKIIRILYLVGVYEPSHTFRELV